MIELEDLPSISQNIYDTMVIDADDVGMAYDEVLQYVEKFEMDEDMLYSFIKERVQKKSERDKGRNVMESLKRALRDPLS